MQVSVFMDVEDPINDLADDAARDVAEVFTKSGVRGSFCLTGEKCRTLLARGRQDVLDAYLPHCLGLHTNTHSYHPTTMELLADCNYEEGCQRALATETKGFDAFVAAFEKKPSFWGGAGNTWSCEIPWALSQLGIEAYSYALTATSETGVHKFNGCVALPQAISIGEDQWAAGYDLAETVLDYAAHFVGPWLGIFVGHPTRFRYQQFWDYGFANGVTPPTPQLADEQDEAVYQASLERLGSFLSDLKTQFKVVGVDEFLEQELAFREPTLQEREFFREQTAANLRSAKGWPIHRPDLDIENIVAKTLALEDTMRVLRTDS